MKIFNLTQHAASPEQVRAGVLEPADKAAVQVLLTFTEPPEQTEIERRAHALADMAQGCEAAMIGGASYLMGPLEAVLAARGIRALHSFSRRESAEERQPDGSVKKVAVFRHVAWVG